MIEQLKTDSPKILAFRMSGKLHDADYKTFVPAVEAAIEAQGKVRLLALFEDFHGWDLHALWDDIKFSTKHCADMERIALVGDRKWEEWMAKVCKKAVYDGEDSLLRRDGPSRRLDLAGGAGISPGGKRGTSAARTAYPVQPAVRATDADDDAGDRTLRAAPRYFSRALLEFPSVSARQVA